MREDYLDFLCSIGELGNIFSESRTLDVFLQRTVESIASHMNADVCSIYLYNEESDLLLLTATRGLNKALVGKVFLKPGEGIVGYALEENEAIKVGRAEEHPSFKPIPNIGEEHYPSFMALPMTRGPYRIGVVIVQHHEENHFQNEDLKALRIITSQLATAIENARLLLAKDGGSEESTASSAGKPAPSFPRLLKGQIGSEGFAHGPVLVFDRISIHDILNRGVIQSGHTLEDYQQALKLTETQLAMYQQTLEKNLSDIASLIFSAHQLILKDKQFTGKIEALIEDGENPARAIAHVVHDYSHVFHGMKDAYMREKAVDIEDLGKRLIDNLEPDEDSRFDYKDKVVVTRGIFPSDILRFFSENVAAVVSIGGGVTSHVSILARSLELPLIITDQTLLLELDAKHSMLLDARHGNIYIDPDEDLVESFIEQESRFEEGYGPLPETGTETADGRRIRLMSNVNLLRDADHAVELNAEGIGLYRTEFPFLVRSNFPTEEEQLYVYQTLLEKMADKPVVFRTLDVGGDKLLTYYSVEGEQNPFLGMRSIRFSLKEREIFRSQLRAILRAGSGHEISIMFPMIASLDEFQEARKEVERCVRDLNEENIPCTQNPKLGMMVEIPGVLEILEELAEEADFFSIGTNDLIQYLLAVDRTNEHVSYLYQPHHPAVLRALERIVRIARNHSIPVSVCGDMGRDVQFIEFFVGIGVQSFSVDPHFIPFVHSAVSTIKYSEAKKHASTLLGLSRGRDIEATLKNKKESGK